MGPSKWLFHCLLCLEAFFSIAYPPATLNYAKIGLFVTLGLNSIFCPEGQSMMNLLSIRCSLAFAPYLLESFADYLQSGDTQARVVRQAANGLIIRSEGELHLRHQNREASLTPGEVKHYQATIGLRAENYRVTRKSDEVVLANLGDTLLLSHPQSELWLPAKAIPSLLAAFKGMIQPDDLTIPEWLTISGGDERLLLSDQRNGRWVLLGSDHFAEFESRYPGLEAAEVHQKRYSPPTIPLKGLQIHLQTLVKLVETLEEFSETGNFTPFEELTTSYQLIVRRATEGMKISDANLIAAVTARESAKWAAILRSEIEKYQVSEVTRGRIKTVRAKTDEGLWLLQWGDEILLGRDALLYLKSPSLEGTRNDNLLIRSQGDFTVVLDLASADCIALTRDECLELPEPAE
jgi:hypothetical protein